MLNIIFRLSWYNKHWDYLLEGWINFNLPNLISSNLNSANIKKRIMTLECSCCKMHDRRWQLYAQRPRIDLNKRFLPDQILPQHESLYPISLISARMKILLIGNFFTKKNQFECNYCKAVFVLVKISFWKIYIVGLNVGDFNSCWF